MRDWMKDCAQHKDCRTEKYKDCTRPTSATFPRRLVKLSPLEESESARLYEIGNNQIEYVALSYCWDGSQKYTTSRETFNEYTEQLPYEQLPQTILDAFTVTRNLGLEYIWIDALCIIQDDVEDVTREISKMRHVYENSQVTISAASAATVQDGFLRQEFVPLDLHKLPTLKDEPHRLLVASNGKDRCEVFSSKPLPVNDRGWTLQEIYFAPRILVFTGAASVLELPHSF
jgi:hypothetical protein